MMKIIEFIWNAIGNWLFPKKKTEVKADEAKKQEDAAQQAAQGAEKTVNDGVTRDDAFGASTWNKR